MKRELKKRGWKKKEGIACSTVRKDGIEHGLGLATWVAHYQVKHPTQIRISYHSLNAAMCV